MFCSIDDNPTFKDLWGYEFNWYDLEDGWHSKKRNYHRKLNKQTLWQSKIMPGYTKNGYTKMKIPHQLYELIKEARNESRIIPERCDEYHSNCIRIKEDGTEGTLYYYTYMVI